MRNGYLDLLRVVGTVAIVLGHIEGLKPLPDYVYPWHVPLYFMLSGWLWRPGSRDFGSEVKVRAKTLLLPYIPWFVIVSVVYGIELWRRGRDSTGKVEEQLPGGAYAIEPYSAFWFITALFVAVVTVRGWRRCACRCGCSWPSASGCARSCRPTRTSRCTRPSPSLRGWGA